MSDAPTYKFHTNILQVNRQIHNEALEILRSNNFVLVSYTWPELSILKHQIGLPVVTEHQGDGAAFQLQALRVHARAASDYAKTTKPKQAKPESFVIVGDEIQTLCFFLKYMHIFHPASARYVVHVGGDRADNVTLVKTPDMGHGVNSSSLKIRINHAAGRQLPSNAIKSLLEPFREISLGAQNAKVSNVPSELSNYAHELEQSMGRRIIWLKARLWDFFNLIRTLKFQGDNSFRRNDLGSAGMQYSCVTRVFERNPFFALDPFLFTGETAELAGTISCVAMVSAITKFAIQIQVLQYDYASASAMVDLIEGATAHYSIVMGSQRDVPDYITQLVGWISVLYRLIFDRTMETLHGAQGVLRSLNTRFSDGIRKYVDHDLA